MVQHSLEDTLALLAHTPAALDALLRNLPDLWIHRNEGGTSWTVFAVVAHLLDADHVNWMPRARHILEFGDTRAFPPFDREAGEHESKDKSLDTLLTEFAHLRAENLAALRALNLQPHQLEHPGRHPALGAVTLSQLLASWAVHDLTHLHQVTRIMASQYHEAVGPWSKFLGVLHCDGHSDPA
ncbi:MAG TPA: DinB family protein [Terracidiphilus sp.]|nr:DinB family protein [Terracidiphilus sp.]